MPHAKITEVVVAHVWDDDSETEIRIKVGTNEHGVPFVALESDGESVRLWAESWEEVRDQIQAMFDAPDPARDD